MRGILFQYELNPTTWVYLSSLMIIGVYFKFRRFWSLRNFDLVALIAFSPGLLLVYHGLRKQLDVWRQIERQLVQLPILDDESSLRLFDQWAIQEHAGQWLEQFGYIWLFGVGGLFLIRLLLDTIVVRRPLLEPNLSAGGLAFTGVALLVFLTSNVVNPRPAQRLEHVLAEQAAPTPRLPGHAPFLAFAVSCAPEVEHAAEGDAIAREDTIRATACRAVAILGHLLIVLAIVLVAYRHFEHIQTGMAVASLYLLLPYTAQMTARVDHLIPAALLVWAVQFYRRPAVAGILIGSAAGLVFYPLFLLPLWCGFYWRRGLYRFAIGVLVALAAAAASLVVLPGDEGSLSAGLQQMFGLTSLFPETLTGFWRYHPGELRIPVIVAFVALCGGLGLWPAQKNLGTLLSCSAAVMLAVQFWHFSQGGLYAAWYLPLLLLTVFRPNLEDRVALSALGKRWIWQRA